jgi:hypothetical protein
MRNSWAWAVLGGWPQLEPPALRSGDGVLHAKRLGVNVRPERENGFGGVVVLAFDVNLFVPLSDVPPPF